MMVTHLKFILLSVEQLVPDLILHMVRLSPQLSTPSTNLFDDDDLDRARVSVVRNQFSFLG